MNIVFRKKIFSLCFLSNSFLIHSHIHSTHICPSTRVTLEVLLVWMCGKHGNEFKGSSKKNACWRDGEAESAEMMRLH